MADIKLSELDSSGSKPLRDSESFLNQLNDSELENIVGGTSVVIVSNQTVPLSAFAPIIEVNNVLNPTALEVMLTLPLFQINPIII